MSIPNIITVFRILLTPVVIWLIITGRMQTAFIFFLIAGISDGVDGYLAKQYGWETELGAYLDAIADKTLLVSIYVTLGVLGYLPLWLLILVVSREFMIIGAFLLSSLLGRPITVKPLLISKANTVAQILLAGTVLGGAGFSLPLGLAIEVLVVLVGVLTIASVAAYLMQWLTFMAGGVRQ